MIRAAVTRWFRPGATVVLGLALLVSISLLVVEVSNRLTALERANSDNSQWVLMQAEVEVLRLQAAIIAARDTPDPARIEEVRRWFNVFYSRVKLIEESPIYATLLAGPDYAPHLARMRGYLDRTVPLIDSPDTTLAAVSLCHTTQVRAVPAAISSWQPRFSSSAFRPCLLRLARPPQHWGSCCGRILISCRNWRALPFC